jgi:uncharacterized protein (DUF362 family)
MDLSFDCLLKYKFPCIKSHHGSKSTLGKLENWTAIVVSDANFWDHVAILGEWLGANMVQ